MKRKSEMDENIIVLFRSHAYKYTQSHSIIISFNFRIYLLLVDDYNKMKIL